MKSKTIIFLTIYLIFSSTIIKASDSETNETIYNKYRKQSPYPPADEKSSSNSALLDNVQRADCG